MYLRRSRILISILIILSCGAQIEAKESVNSFSARRYEAFDTHYRYNKYLCREIVRKWRRYEALRKELRRLNSDRFMTGYYQDTKKKNIIEEIDDLEHCLWRCYYEYN